MDIRQFCRSDIPLDKQTRGKQASLKLKKGRKISVVDSCEVDRKAILRISSFVPLLLKRKECPRKVITQNETGMI